LYASININEHLIHVQAASTFKNAFLTKCTKFCVN